jgi:hypothetical protein
MHSNHVESCNRQPCNAEEFSCKFGFEKCLLLTLPVLQGFAEQAVPDAPVVMSARSWEQEWDVWDKTSACCSRAGFTRIFIVALLFLGQSILIWSRISSLYDQTTEQVAAHTSRVNRLEAELRRTQDSHRCGVC